MGLHSKAFRECWQKEVADRLVEEPVKEDHKKLSGSLRLKSGTRKGRPKDPGRLRGLRAVMGPRLSRFLWGLAGSETSSSVGESTGSVDEEEVAATLGARRVDEPALAEEPGPLATCEHPPSCGDMVVTHASLPVSITDTLLLPDTPPRKRAEHVLLAPVASPVRNALKRKGSSISIDVASDDEWDADVKMVHAQSREGLKGCPAKYIHRGIPKPYIGPKP